MSGHNPSPDQKVLGGGGRSLAGSARVTAHLPFAMSGRLGLSGGGRYTVPLLSGGHSLSGAAKVKYSKVSAGCVPLPAAPQESDACAADTYRCVKTNPSSVTCRKMLYVFAPQYFRGGFEYAGYADSGAYVPAVTVCNDEVDPTPIGNLRQNPDKRVFGY